MALLVAAALLWPLPSTRNRLEEQVPGFRALWGEIVFVLRYVRTDRLIAWGVVQWTIGSTLALIVATLAPTFVVGVLGIRAEDSVFVLAPAGIGTVLGSVLLSRWGDRLDRRRLIEGALMALGALLAADGAGGDALAAGSAGSPTRASASIRARSAGGR